MFTPTRRNLVRLYLIDLAERVGWTAVQTFLAVLVASGWFSVDGVVDTSILQRAGIAAIAAVLALLKGVVAKLIGDRNSASTAPEVAIHTAPSGTV